MIRDLQIDNFKCFRKVEAHGLGRLNVVVGANANGKTSLLEAFDLASSSLVLQSVRTLLSFRGVEAGGKGSEQNAELLEATFHNFDFTKSVRVNLSGDDEDSRSLEILSEAPEDILSGRSGPHLSVPLQFSFRWEGAGKVIRLTSEGEDRRFTFRQQDFAAFPCGMHSSSIPRNASNVEDFSILSKENRDRQFVMAIQQEFPFIQDLSIQLDKLKPSLFASIKGLDKKVPIGSVSDGVEKLIDIALLLYSMPPGSLLLIDQIEDGLYYKKLEGVWRFINRVSKERKIQVIATTHSAECLSAFYVATKLDQSDARLIRMEGSVPETSIQVIQGSRLAAALKQNFELR